MHTPPTASDILLDLVVLVAAALLAAQVARRLRLPGVVVEIAAGVVIGPSVLGLVGEGWHLGLLGGLGIAALLLEVGLHFDLSRLGSSARPAVLVALTGTALTLVAGWGAVRAAGQPGDIALFLAAGVTATSIGITARVFADLGRLATTEARVVLGAAVVDDILGLVTLSVVTRIASGGSISSGTVLASGTILGAFGAGLALGRAGHAGPVQRLLDRVGRLLVPMFFLRVGIDADLGAIVRPGALGLAAVLLAAAVAAKLACGASAVGVRGDRLLIGLGMLPRGEVGLVFAALGLHEGILDTERYGALLLVIFVTDLIAPFLLRWRLRAHPGGRWR